MKISAGLLMYRLNGQKIEYFLVHYGGPFFKNKEAGSWSIPKGEIEAEEDALNTAKREFFEETGIEPNIPFLDLGSIKQKGGKMVKAWAFEYKGKLPVIIHSNTFELEWPPRSGKKQEFPEVDKGEFFPEKEARIRINSAQVPLIERARDLLKKNK